MSNMNKTKSGLAVGSFAVLAVGSYVLWQNRFKIQRFLEANGISTSWMTGSVAEAVQSGAAKISGNVEHAFKSVTDSKVHLDTPKVVSN